MNFEQPEKQIVMYESIVAAQQEEIAALKQERDKLTIENKSLRHDLIQAKAKEYQVKFKP